MIDPVVQDRKREETREVLAEMKETQAWKAAEYWVKYDMTVTELREKLDEIEYDDKCPCGLTIMEMVTEYKKDELMEHD